MRFGSDLLGRMVLHSNSPSRLRKARDCFAAWALEEPNNTALPTCVVEIDARLKILGKKEPAAIPISSRARAVVDELGLPGELMLEFLSEAEILIEADGNDPEETYELMVHAAWEYATLIVLANARPRTQ